MPRLKFVVSVLLLAFLSLPAFATTNVIVHKTLVSNGITRYYSVSVPSNLAKAPELIITLHGLEYAASTPAPTPNFYGWDYQCKQSYGTCLAVAAQSTWDPDSTEPDPTGYWAWNGMYFDNMVFSGSSYPQDSAYIRALITQLHTDYNIDVKKVAVVGFSVGAFMAARVVDELSDVVAVVSINSGALQSTLGTKVPGIISNPISVIEYHGTLDNNKVGIEPCGRVWDWNHFLPEKSSSDDTFNFFVTNLHCTPVSAAPLCDSSSGTLVYNNNDTSFCGTGTTSNAEVKFVWEVGTAHKYLTTHNQSDLTTFFRKHWKP